MSKKEAEEALKHLVTVSEGLDTVLLEYDLKIMALRKRAAELEVELKAATRNEE